MVFVWTLLLLVSILRLTKYTIEIQIAITSSALTEPDRGHITHKVKP